MSLRSIGTTIPGAMPIRTYGADAFADSAKIIDEAFDVAWTGDHLLWHYPVLDPIVALSSIALLTRKVQLGTGILHVPIRPVLPTAKALASLDHLSGGRLIVGIGVGGEMESEFSAVGVPLSERGVRTDEAITAFRALWRERPATFRGRFVEFEDAVMEPAPATPEGPPIWVGGRTPAALRRAARLGDGWLALFLTPDGFARCREQLLAQLPPGRTLEMAIHLPTCIGRADAVERLRAFYAHFPQIEPDRFAPYWLHGSPNQIIESIGQFADAGADHVVLAPPGPEFVAQLERLATEVVPVLRREIVRPMTSETCT